MTEEQYHLTRVSTNAGTLQRIRRSILIGMFITLVLTCIEIAILWAFNPYHLLGDRATPGLADFLTLPLHAPLWWLVPTGELLVTSLTVYTLAQPLALLAYLREVRRTQERSHKIYTPLTILPEPDTHQLILGVPGAGKTMALSDQQYLLSQHRWAIIRGHSKVPVYVPMKNYSLFLKARRQTNNEPEQELTLLDFLRTSALPGMRQLRPYLKKLIAQGRVLLLCDGLNEIDRNYLNAVSEELEQLMLTTNNRLLMTCREVDYRELSRLRQLVDDGHVVCATIYPLRPEQIREFVERYIREQGGWERMSSGTQWSRHSVAGRGTDEPWQHTAGQIMEVITRSRLSQHCTNPMMLFTLMEIIDGIGVERGKQIDTRGLLLREFVSQLIQREQRQGRWSNEAPAENVVVAFLSELACAARWANDRNAIQLRVSQTEKGWGGERMSSVEVFPRDHVADIALRSRGHSTPNSEELAEELQVWLDEHPAQGPWDTINQVPTAAYDRLELAQLLQFTQSAGLIDISPNGVLSFRHELIAEYFVAEYFVMGMGVYVERSRQSEASWGADTRQHPSVPIREELLADVARWSEPVTIWAGLLDDPMALAERLAALAQRNPAYAMEALTLSLVCIGVLWTPPQAEQQRPVVLPSSVEDVLAVAVRNAEAREKLAHIFTRCAEEGGQEVYRSLLPLLTIDGVDQLLVLLDETVVPELLFTYLFDVVDDVVHEPQVKRLIRVLGRFGAVVVARATSLSQPESESSLRLRAVAVNILGRTDAQRAVEPLIARLSDPEQAIVDRAANALITLGPRLVVARVIQELENRTSPSRRLHELALTILGRFLEEQTARGVKPPLVTALQRQRILEAMLSVLTSNYTPETQQRAIELLIRQGQGGGESGEKIIAALIQSLSSGNEQMTENIIQVLQKIGPVATPRLLTELQQQPSETARAHIVQVFAEVRDPRALPQLLSLVADPAPVVQKQIAEALRAYAPECIPELLHLVLFDTREEVAGRAAQILGEIGEEVVAPIMQALLHAVPGRTRLLVYVLEHVHDPQAIPTLIELMETSPIEPLLAIAIVHALSQYQDVRVVAPLINVLASTNVQLYEEAINALSHLGELALAALLATLDVAQETATTPRVRRAILGMVPFPTEQLIEALAQSSDAQAQQLVAVFLVKGSEAARVLVTYLANPNQRVRDCVRQTLTTMEGRVAVPALLEVLNRPVLYPAVAELLHEHSQEAIPPLVSLLADHDRGDAAAAILQTFGPEVLSALAPGLDDQSSTAQQRAQSVLVHMIRQTPIILSRVVRLFASSLSPRAREALLDVLTDELADLCIPALLEGLEDARLMEGVSTALVRLVHKRDTYSEVALKGLFDALYMEERQRGARMVLVNIGAQAVPGASALMTSPDPSVAQAAQQILRNIGVAAFPVIWAASSDVNNRAQREAALSTFRSMPTVEIKDGLIEHLTGDRPEEVSMALGLLLERIHHEDLLPIDRQEMLPTLLNYVQTHNDERANQRIIALLLLLGGRNAVNHMAWALYHYANQPNHQEMLTRALLLLGEEAEDILMQMLHHRPMPAELLAEVVSVLGMLTPHQEIYEYARAIGSISSTGLADVPFSDRRPLALRALGGLLAGGHLNIATLQDRQRSTIYGALEHELYSVLLGEPYGPRLTSLENRLRDEQSQHERDKREQARQVNQIKEERDDLQEQQSHLEERNRLLEARNRQLEQMLLSLRGPQR